MSTNHVRDEGARRARLFVALFFVMLFIAFGLTARHGNGSWDYYTANYASWHLVHEGNPWLDEEGTVPGLEGDPEAGVWVMQAENGHTVVRRFPGVIAIGLPAYWIAQADEMTVIPGAITAALACALGITMLFLALRTRLSQRTSALACGVLAFGTPVWTIAADSVWPHTVSVLGLGGMAWAASKQRWWLVGVFGGVTLWGRLHAAIIVAVVGLLLGLWRRSPRITVVIGTISLTFMGLVCAWTRWWTGSWNPLSSYGSDVLGLSQTGSTSFTSELVLLVSPDRGILVWTPILLLLTPALVRGWKEVPDWAKAMFWGGLVYTVFQAWIARAVGGDSFYGYRHGIEFVVAATPAYAMTVHRLGSTARKWVTPVVTLQICAMFVGAVIDPFLAMEKVWTDNAFFYAMRETWPAGPIMLLSVFFLVYLVKRMLRSEDASKDDPAAETVSAHSR
jgi:alpha-1,2-mannosyltransferase